MYKFNNGYGALICDICRVIIQEPAKEPKLQQQDLCFRCEEVDTNLDNWLEENKELLEDMKEGK